MVSPRFGRPCSVRDGIAAAVGLFTLELNIPEPGDFPVGSAEHILGQM